MRCLHASMPVCDPPPPLRHPSNSLHPIGALAKLSEAEYQLIAGAFSADAGRRRQRVDGPMPEARAIARIFLSLSPSLSLALIYVDMCVVPLNWIYV